MYSLPISDDNENYIGNSDNYDGLDIQFFLHLLATTLILIISA